MQEASTTETGENLLGELHDMLAAGVIVLRLDYKRLNQIDSPVGAESDSAIWVYAPVLMALAAYFLGGVSGSIGAFLGGILLYVTIGRALVRKRIMLRVEKAALRDLSVWQKLWRFGGITLVVPKHGNALAYAGPSDNWIKLVRQLRAEITNTDNVAAEH